MRFVNRTSCLVLAGAFALLSARNLSAQEQCQCAAPGAESSRIASAIGGGLFAGLLAAVIPFHHATALAAAPTGASADSAAPSALVEHADSSDIAPEGAPARALASAAGEPAASSSEGNGRFDPGKRVASAARLPSMTPAEAEADGMIAPRTATMLPALAMIGIGAIIMGIFFLRVRSPHRHY